MKLRTSRGVEIDAIADFPDSPVKVPAVVIAPGQGYSMNLPIIEGLAKAAARNGMAAIRFNWNYYSTDPQNGQPSDDLKNEEDDLKTAVAFAQHDSRIDPKHIFLAGKSLGTIVSYSVFRQDPSLEALFLMTPLCTRRWDDNGKPLPVPVASGNEYYPDFTSTKRPVVLTLGNADPHCSLPMLYDFLKDTHGNVTTVVVGGNHTWDIGPYNDPAFTKRNAENIDAAIQTMVHWFNLLLKR